MRNSKRFLTLVLAVLMVMSTFAFSTSAATFTDVKIDTKALYQATGLLSDLGVAKGTTETTFSPGENVTREQAAAFVYRLFKAGKSLEGGINTTSFQDLTDPTFYGMISWASSQGIIKGRSETVFDPKGGIILQDFYTIIVRALGYEKKETLAYPFGYIDIAEKLELDKNLPSSLNYSDTLTRGDVAIILYNTFFAELAEGETSYVGTVVNGVPVATPVTVYPTVAEKIFSVKKSTQRVVATPNYYLDGAAIDTNFDTDVLLFNGTASYRTFEELGLSGKADDYFLSDFTLYLKDETKDDGTVETKVLYAEPLLTKKTVTKATVGKVTPVKASDYYNQSNKSYAKASGLLTIDGVKAYLYDAPYSYTKPQITTDIASNSVKYYEALNKKNVEFIGLAPEVDEGVYHFVSSAYNATLDNNSQYDIFGLPEKSLYGTYNDGTATVEVYSYTADVFTNALNQMYSEGYYELDVYDSDSDGVIDYIWYKPYTFGQAISDEDYPTLSVHSPDKSETAAFSAVPSDENVPTIYTYEATVQGASFKNKDFVIAYVNGPANYIKVAAVVEKTTAAVKSYNQSNYNVVLNNGTTINTYGTHKLFVNFASGDAESGSNGEAFETKNSFGDLYNAAYLEQKKDFYVYGGRLLYTEVVRRPEFDKEANIIIPLASETKWGSAMENGYLVQRPAISAYISGSGLSSVLVPVEVENNEPETPFVDVGDGYYDFSEYANRLNTFSESNGIYTLIKAVTDENTTPAAAAALMTNDETAQYGISDDNFYFTKVTGNTYKFTDAVPNGNSSLLPNGALYVSIQSYTKIIIKSKSETTGDYIFTEYSASKLPNIANPLREIDMILINNPNSTKTEYLGALYARIDGVIETGTDVSESNENIRIVKTNGTIDKDESGTYHFYYDVYNPFTGAVESNIPGYKGSTRATNLSSPATIGKFYEVINGVLQDKNNPWFDGKEVFPSNGFISRSEVNPTPSYLVQIADYSNRELEIKGDPEIYRTDSDTKVILLEAGGNGKNDFKWATATAKSVDDLGSSSTALRNYCVTTNPDTGRITTAYADNIEAYVAVDANKSIAGQYKMVDFIIILRDKVSDPAYLNSND